MSFIPTQNGSIPNRSAGILRVALQQPATLTLNSMQQFARFSMMPSDFLSATIAINFILCELFRFRLSSVVSVRKFTSSLLLTRRESQATGEIDSGRTPSYRRRKGSTDEEKVPGTDKRNSVNKLISFLRHRISSLSIDSVRWMARCALIWFYSDYLCPSMHSKKPEFADVTGRIRHLGWVNILVGNSC